MLFMLVTCPDCGHQFDDQLSACPSCGTVVESQDPQRNLDEEDSTQSPRDWPLLLSVVIFCASLVALMFLGKRAVPVVIFTFLNMAFRFAIRRLRP
jgi:uncharacterized membrane protein YvbJ